MSTEVTTKSPVAIGERGVQLREMSDAWRFCEAVHKSGIAPKCFKSPEQIFVAVQTGMESGLGPMAALRAIYVLDGRPGWYGEAAKAVIIRSPLCKSWDEGLDGAGPTRAAWVKTERAGMGEKVTRFSTEEARRMGLLDKSNWKADPDSMLLWRATGRHAKRWYADLLLGLPVADEIEDRYTNGATVPMSVAPAIEGPKDDPLFLPAGAEFVGPQEARSIIEEAAAEAAGPAPTDDDLPFSPEPPKAFPLWSGSFMRYMRQGAIWLFTGNDGTNFRTSSEKMKDESKDFVGTGEPLVVEFEERDGSKWLVSVSLEGAA